MIKAYTALCKLSGLLDMNEDNFGADMVVEESQCFINMWWVFLEQSEKVMGDRVLRSENDADVWKATKQRAGESLCFSSIPLLSSPIKPWERQSEAGAEQPESLALNGTVSAKWKYSVFSSTLSGSPQYGPLGHHHNHKRQLHLNCHSSLQSLYLSASVSFLCHISLVFSYLSWS